MLLAKEFISNCGPLERASIDPRVITMALTAPSSNDDVNYERFEILGDSVVKILIAMHLFCTLPQATEGELSQKKNYFVSNSFLSSCAHSKKLLDYVFTDPVSVKNWTPPGSGVALFAHEITF